MSPAGSQNAPETRARAKIDAQLEASGWLVQDYDDMNLSAAPAVAVREFRMKSGHGFVDYLLFLDGQAIGTVEAKPAGHTLIGVEPQALKYATGLPDKLDTPYRPLPFAYLATGEVTCLINMLDPQPRSRRVFAFHRPTTLAEWLEAESIGQWVASTHGAFSAFEDPRPSTLRSRLGAMPPVVLPGLWPNKVAAIERLEDSLKRDKPRALIQMTTGSGKTLLAVTALYRLIKFGGARRVLFLVDRTNLGEQALKEFEAYRTPDDNRKLTELFNVQHLTSNTIGASSKIVISTIQRLYSILKGEPAFDEEQSEANTDRDKLDLYKEPLPVTYDPSVPPEFFDVIVIDECHRSIYTLWRQVLEYFDAYLIGLTATPAKHTYGFFNQNLVMEYGHDKAVADGVNVDFEVYEIRTEITANGSTVEAGPAMLGRRDRQTRALRWERADEDFSYDASDLDKNVVAKDQIRLIVKTYRDRVLPEAFSDRKEVPKTLIFAKDDSHAEDIVEILREEFGRGIEFAQKITYKVTGKKPRDLIQEFRTAFFPRVVVTVDLIATGTDIKPVEVVIFMRQVKSRVLYEQMKGRGVRVIDTDELRAVTPDAKAKDRFLVVDCVGIAKLVDSSPLEKQPTVSLKTLLDHVGSGGSDRDGLASLAGRLARLDHRLGPDERAKVEALTQGHTLGDIATAIVDAIDPDEEALAARQMFALGPDDEPTDEQRDLAGKPLRKKAVAILAKTPALRRLILELREKLDQVIDEVSKDQLIEDRTGISAAAKDRAKALVQDFESYLAEHKDEIDALQFFYATPHRERLRLGDIKALAAAISAPPRSWTPEKLWRAYELLAHDKVRGASGDRLLTDIVSLVRYALHQDDVLVPHGDRVRERFAAWMAQQANRGRKFTPDQERWLTMMRDHISESMAMELDDLELTPFTEAGGRWKAAQVFGAELVAVVDELNRVLAA